MSSQKSLKSKIKDKLALFEKNVHQNNSYIFFEILQKKLDMLIEQLKAKSSETGGIQGVLLNKGISMAGDYCQKYILDYDKNKPGPQPIENFIFYTHRYWDKIRENNQECFEEISMRLLNYGKDEKSEDNYISELIKSFPSLPEKANEIFKKTTKKEKDVFFETLNENIKMSIRYIEFIRKYREISSRKEDSSSNSNSDSEQEDEEDFYDKFELDEVLKKWDMKKTSF